MSPFLPIFIGLTAVRLLTQIRAEARSSSDTRPKLYESEEARTGAQYASYLLAWGFALHGLLDSSRRTKRVAAGLGVLAFGMGLRLFALATLGRDFAPHLVVRQDQRLVTAGVYGVVRHPLHLGLVIEILGMSLAGRSPLAWIVPPVATAVLVSRNRVEDQALLRLMGPAVADYQARVPGMNLPLGLWRIVRRARGPRPGE